MRGAELDATFTEFVTVHRTNLRRIAYGICGDWHQADDILQIALVKLYSAWPRVRRDGGEEAYVRTIIVRTTIDERRRPWRRERSGLDGDDQAGPSGAEPEQWSPLFEALQALPVMQRKTVLLRHWLGLSVQQTAVELGISPGTVKSHTSRAVQRLQEVLARTRT
jgi:RNA polymerase sigma-70 factor (sigma-E family)